MNSYDEERMRAVRSDVVHTAEALASGALPFLDGVRRLVKLRFEVSSQDHDPDFMLFVGVESQADHIPNAEVRSLCTSAWLEKCDRETKELEAFYGQQVQAACAQLVKRFTAAA